MKLYIFTSVKKKKHCTTLLVQHNVNISLVKQEQKDRGRKRCIAPTFSAVYKAKGVKIMYTGSENMHA